MVADLPAAPTAAPVVVKAETGIDHIRVDFSEFGTTDAETGGSTILSYNLQTTVELGTSLETQVIEDWLDVGGQVGNESLRTEYTIYNRVKGETYGFRYRAINVNGAGPWSAVSLIKAATIPSTPAAPTYSSSSDTQIVLDLSRSLDDGGHTI